MLKRSHLAKAIMVGLLATTSLIGAEQLHATEAKSAPAVQGASSDAGQTDAVAQMTGDAKDQAIVKTVDEAFKALREVRGARLAIFNGEPEAALELVNAAKANLEVVDASAAEFAVDTKKSSGGEVIYVPFDVSMSLAEGFVPTEEKAAAITQANEHMKKGDQKQAAEALRMANVDLTVSAALIPAHASLLHVDDAANLLAENKYYEANIALKAIEDGVVIDSYSIDAVPAQGQAQAG